MASASVKRLLGTSHFSGTLTTITQNRHCYHLFMGKEVKIQTLPRVTQQLRVAAGSYSSSCVAPCLRNGRVLPVCQKPCWLQGAITCLLLDPVSKLARILTIQSSQGEME